MIFFFFLAASLPYEQLSDLYHPTIEDYRTIQQFLAEGERPELRRMGDKEFLAREFRLVGKSPEEVPESGRVVVNCEESERENCIIIYSSFNERYPRGLKRLVDVIAHSNFKGHVYYRIGGWPNTEEGDLLLAHVPFAFKPCFFREMQKMGYKHVLWLDASILPSPFVSLNKIFKMIAERKCFIQGNTHTLGPYMNEEAAHAFGLTLEETYAIPSCSAAILGLDLTDSKAASVIDAWYQAAQDPDAFYSPRSDQSALSIILYQKGFRNFLPPSSLGERQFLDKDHNALFFMDRGYVKDR